MISRFPAFLSPESRSGKKPPMGCFTLSMNPLWIAIPTRADITLFDADFRLARRVGRVPLKYSSTSRSPRQLINRLCRRGSRAASSRARSKETVGSISSGCSCLGPAEVVNADVSMEQAASAASHRKGLIPDLATWDFMVRDSTKISCFTVLVLKLAWRRLRHSFPVIHLINGILRPTRVFGMKICFWRSHSIWMRCQAR